MSTTLNLQEINGNKYEINSKDGNVSNGATHSVTTSSKPSRDQWGGQMEFLLACLGNAVGLGNVSTFK